MNDPYRNYRDLISFLAIWFKSLQKSSYNVNVVNKEVDKVSPLLHEKLKAILSILQKLEGKELKVKVSNQKELNTKELENKLSALLIGVKGIKLDNSSVENLLADLISLSGGIRKVEVLNQPKMPSKMDVSGKVEVSNFPKVQEFKGDFKLKEAGDILDSLKDLASEIRDLKLESIQGYKNIGSTFVGTTGSREAHKITDGSKNASITAIGDNNALDVNVVSSTALKLTESGTSTYVAIAPMGSSQASAVWQAKKIDESSGLVITWADGNADFDNVATDLTALSYS